MEGTRLTLTSVACWMLHYAIEDVLFSILLHTSSNQQIPTGWWESQTVPWEHPNFSDFLEVLTMRTQNSSKLPVKPVLSYQKIQKHIKTSPFSAECNCEEGWIKTPQLWNQILIGLIQAFSSWLCGTGQKGSALVADIALQTSRLTRETPVNAHSCWKARFLFKCLEITCNKSWLYRVVPQFHLLLMPGLNLLSLSLDPIYYNLELQAAPVGFWICATKDWRQEKSLHGLGGMDGP